MTFNKKGFTLIEILITMGIMAVMTATSYPYIQEAYHGQIAKRHFINIESVNAASQNFYTSFRAWPDESNDCEGAISNLISTKYLPANFSNDIGSGVILTTSCVEEGPNNNRMFKIISNTPATESKKNINRLLKGLLPNAEINTDNTSVTVNSVKPLENALVQAIGDNFLEKTFSLDVNGALQKTELINNLGLTIKQSSSLNGVETPANTYDVIGNGEHKVFNANNVELGKLRFYETDTNITANTSSVGRIYVKHLDDTRYVEITKRANLLIKHDIPTIKLQSSNYTNGYYIKANISDDADYGLTLEHQDGTDIANFKKQSVLIGASAATMRGEAHGNYDDLTIKGTGHTGITLKSAGRYSGYMVADDEGGMSGGFYYDRDANDLQLLAERQVVGKRIKVTQNLEITKNDDTSSKLVIKQNLDYDNWRGNEASLDFYRHKDNTSPTTQVKFKDGGIKHYLWETDTGKYSKTTPTLIEFNEYGILYERVNTSSRSEGSTVLGLTGIDSEFTRETFSTYGPCGNGCSYNIGKLSYDYDDGSYIDSSVQLLGGIELDVGGISNYATTSAIPSVDMKFTVGGTNYNEATATWDHTLKTPVIIDGYDGSMKTNSNIVDYKQANASQEYNVVVNKKVLESRLDDTSSITIRDKVTQTKSYDAPTGITTRYQSVKIMKSADDLVFDESYGHTTAGVSEMAGYFYCPLSHPRLGLFSSNTFFEQTSNNSSLIDSFERKYPTELIKGDTNAAQNVKYVTLQCSFYLDSPDNCISYAETGYTWEYLDGDSTATVDARQGFKATVISDQREDRTWDRMETKIEYTCHSGSVYPNSDIDLKGRHRVISVDQS